MNHDVGWHVPINKLKFKYENAEWQQIDKHYDIFKDLNMVEARCGDDPFCWLDIYHWSLMNKTRLTEDVYQFIVHRVGVIQQAFKENFWYGINHDFVRESLEALQIILGGLHL